MPYVPTWNNPYLQNSYQPMIPSMTVPGQQTPMPYQSQQSVNGVIKVNGRESALQYNLPPNSMSPALFDNNGQVFYIVSTDGTGAKTVEVFDFTPHVEQQSVEIDGARFVSRQEFDDFVTKVSAAIGAIDGIHGSVQTATTA